MMHPSGPFLVNITLNCVSLHFYKWLCLDLMASYGVNWKPGVQVNADWELVERNAWWSVFGDTPFD
jgi:hypothetical protein